MVIGIDASRANVRERTGTEWYAYHVIRGIVARNQSTQFVLYFADAPRDDLKDLGPNVEYRVLRWPPKYLWSQVRLSWEMLVRPPTVLFVPAHTMPFIHPRRTVVTIHDLGFEALPALYGHRHIGGERKGRGMLLNLLVRMVTLGRYGNSELDYHRWSARFASKRAWQIIAVSEFTKAEIIRWYHVAPVRISVIYHGFDASAFRRPPEHIIEGTRRSFNIQTPYLLFTGRLEKKKNITGLISVFAATRTLIPRLQLVLIGKPGLGWDDALELIARHHLSSSIHFLGWQPPTILTPLLSGAAAFLFLSRYEGFGMPLLEAFALGTPVVCSGAGALPEVGADAVEYVDPDNLLAAAQTIATIVTDLNHRRQRIQRGLKRVKQFTWDAAALQTIAVLTKQ